MGVPLGRARHLSIRSTAAIAGDVVRFVSGIEWYIPSIIIGIVAYGLVVLRPGTFFGARSGVALIMMVPGIAPPNRCYSPVPQAIREAAYGSESTLAYHAFHHLGPTSGAVTGVMLAFARVAEERRHYIVYGLRKPVLELEIGSTHGRLVITDFHLRHFALRRVAPAGVGWCIGFDRSDRGCGRGGSPCGEARDIGGSVTVMGVGITVEHVNAFYGKTQALFDINLIFQANHATALIGPSGCGKSTFIRCLNRMHETIPDARVEGTVRIGDLSVYNGTSATQLRRRVGMVFQKANPFPTMSIYDNVASGLKLNGFRNRKQLDEVVERSLNSAALWDEVKDHLHKKSGASLSGGQQQRLCIARALADQPEVLLMDDHSALGPISTN